MSKLVTLYTKPGSCGQCTATIRALNTAEIPFQEIVVNPSDKQSIDELRRIAKQLGDTETMPYVMVLDRDTEDIQGWFGFRPDKIAELKKEQHP
ncbi:glutaredoxin family protein [Glutamicibacter arilaitensis]|uniref:glutaredoxin family protein n=1 Tax=Glutamicibacter arilaitensis TaxID=256701 RepID=UPI003A930C75